MRNGRNGGQEGLEGLEGTNTDQHDEESKAFGHQRQRNSIRWPTLDCGLERMRADCRMDGIRDRDHAALKSHRTSLAILSAPGDSGGEEKDRYLPKVRH